MAGKPEWLWIVGECVGLTGRLEWVGVGRNRLECGGEDR